ncbi:MULTISPECIES: hypothetical protein [unclassified Chryseobacterium]|uniref:hypothetical protein n=1 Tax=unclassified Chryseobacterium TaxID=2593645 RepID=UPI00226A39C9|nr:MULTISPECIES: hypothetical protein [unclassified Chryseobacterium]
MKKLILPLFLASALGLSAQKKINIFNYTAYNLSNSLVGSNQANNCYPSVSGTNHPIPVAPGGAVTYNGYYGSHLQNPPINSWNVELSPTSSSTQPSTSPLLITLGNTTDWMMNKFSLSDPSGAPLYYSGASIGMIGCNTPVISDLTPSAATPYPFTAFWFPVGNETYFVIQ